MHAARILPATGEHVVLGASKYAAIRKWFLAGQSLGEFIGIRFGQITSGGGEPVWSYYSHAEYDGIGAFATILRDRGAQLKQLPQIKYYPAYSPVGSALKHWYRYMKPRRKLSWTPMLRNGRTSAADEPPSAVSWHVFDAATSYQIRLESKKSGVTVNTLLLRALTEAIRLSVHPSDAPIPWMIPVNMRGGVNQFRDTDNHSSYVATTVSPKDSLMTVHRRILLSLSRGEHWGNWHAFKTGNWVPRWARQFLVAQGLCFSQWSVGSFSNLGEWDPDKKVTSAEATGDWLFCPPALRSQLIAAGCISFQGRLSLTIQAHPELTTDSTVTRRWMESWVGGVNARIGAAPAGRFRPSQNEAGSVESYPMRARSMIKT